MSEQPMKSPIYSSDSVVNCLGCNQPLPEMARWYFDNPESQCVFRGKPVFVEQFIRDRKEI